MGLVIPEIALKVDNGLNYSYYNIVIQGTSSLPQRLFFNKSLAIIPKRSKISAQQFTHAIEVKEPTYGLKALWLDELAQVQASASGLTVYKPIQVLTSHLNEAIRQQLPSLLSRQETEQLLKHSLVKTAAEELIPQMLSLSQVQKILQNLLEEKVSIRPIALILETLLENAKNITDISSLTDLVRLNLASIICQTLTGLEGGLSVLTFSTDLEQQLQKSLHSQQWNLEPSFTEKFLASLMSEVEKMILAKKKPILLCSSGLRRPVKQLTRRILPQLTLLGMNEIPINFPVEAFSVVY